MFADCLYDDASATGAPDDPFAFAFDLDDEGAPHDALTIYWNRGLAAGASLRDLPDAAVNLAYRRFLKRFDRLNQAWREQEAR